MGESRNKELSQGRLPNLHSLQSQELLMAAGTREDSPVDQNLSGVLQPSLNARDHY